MGLDAPAGLRNDVSEMEPIVVDHGLAYLREISDRHDARWVMDAPSPMETRLVWCGDDTRGFANSLRLSSGVELSLFCVRSSVHLHFEALHAPLGLEIGISGASALRALTPWGRDLAMPERTMSLREVKEPVSLRCESTGTGYDHGACLRFDTATVANLLGVAGLPARIDAVVRAGGPFVSEDRPLSDEAWHALQSLTGCTLVGPLRRLFLEAKALELLAHALSPFLDGKLQEAEPGGCRRDADRLEEARAELDRTLADPPSLVALARHCGLNERKLKEGFKSRYGQTVFSYVRRKRLEMARALLADKRCNVAEAALIVGYANPSKFAAAFRRTFGASPSVLLRRRGGRCKSDERRALEQ